MQPLKLTSGTLMQKTFDKVGTGLQYDSVYFTIGNYTVNTPIKLNSGTKLTGDIGAIITLTAGVSTSLFPSMTPIFGQKTSKISNITIENITFDGNKDKQTVAHGKGYHNFIGLSNCTGLDIHSVTIQNSQGDGARITDSSNIKFYNNKVNKCGHDGLYVDRCSDVEAYGNLTYTRANSALRSKGSKNVSFHDNVIYGTTEAYAPGIQIENSKANETSSNVNIINNSIFDTYGPGIWAAGHTATSTNAASGLTIKNNLIVKCGQMPAGNKISGVCGISCDGWNNVSILNNTFDSCRGYSVLFWKYLTTSAGSGYKATVKNNIFTHTAKSATVGTASGTAVANLIPAKYTVEVNNNCFYGNVKDVYGVTASASILKDPLYVDGYHLASGSPCYQLGCYGGGSSSPILLKVSCTEEQGEKIKKVFEGVYQRDSKSFIISCTSENFESVKGSIVAELVEVFVKN